MRPRRSRSRLAADEHGSQRAAKIPLLLEVDEGERSGGVGEPARAGFEAGVMEQPGERAQAGEQIRLRHLSPSPPGPAPADGFAPGPPGTSAPSPGSRPRARRRSG